MDLCPWGTFSDNFYFKDENLSKFQRDFFKNLGEYICLESNYKSLGDNYLDNVATLIIQSISKKDAYTGGHTKRVGMFAEMICDELGAVRSLKKKLVSLQSFMMLVK